MLVELVCPDNEREYLIHSINAEEDSFWAYFKLSTVAPASYDDLIVAHTKSLTVRQLIAQVTDNPIAQLLLQIEHQVIATILHGFSSTEENNNKWS